MLRLCFLVGSLALVASAPLYDKDPNVEQLNSLNFHTVRMIDGILLAVFILTCARTAAAYQKTGLNESCEADRVLYRKLRQLQVVREGVQGFGEATEGSD